MKAEPTKFPDTEGKESSFIAWTTRKIELPLTDVGRFLEEAGLENTFGV